MRRIASHSPQNFMTPRLINHRDNFTPVTIMKPRPNRTYSRVKVKVKVKVKATKAQKGNTGIDLLFP